MPFHGTLGYACEKMTAFLLGINFHLRLFVFRYGCNWLEPLHQEFRREGWTEKRSAVRLQGVHFIYLLLLFSFHLFSLTLFLLRCFIVGEEKFQTKISKKIEIIQGFLGHSLVFKTAQHDIHLWGRH